MPKTSSTKTVSADQATTATPDTSDVPPSANTGNLYVLGYLSPAVGKTTVDVAAAIGIGRSTAQKALTSLEAEGLTRREPGVREGARRSPDLWFDARTPTTAADEPNGDTPLEESQDPASDPVQPATIEPETIASGPETPEQAASEPDDVDQDRAEQEAIHTAEVASAETTDADSIETGPDTGQASASEPDTVEQHGVDQEVVESAEPAPADAAEPKEASPAEQSAPPAASDVSPNTDLTTAPDTAVAAEKAKKAKKTPTKAPKKSAPAAVAPQPEPADAPATPRLAHGELRTMVADFLRAHPERAWTPSAIAKALGGKSAGAVANACEKLLDTMDGLKTFDDAPRRYQYTPPAPPKKKTK